MKTMRCSWFLLLIVLLTVASVAAEKINPANYPETAVVSSAKVVSESTGTTTKHNSACDNPQTPFMRGFCATSGTQTANNSRRHIEVIATIGNNIYTLSGYKMPPPGDYKARFLDNGSIELMGPNAKGELHAHKFAVIAIEAKEPAK